jgi:predicted ester cyclase
MNKLGLIKLAVAALAISLAGCGQDSARTAKKEIKSAKKDKAKKDKAKKDEAGDKKAAPVDNLALLTAGMKAYSEGDFDKTLEAFADDAQWIVIGDPRGPLTGKDAIKKSWEENRKAFPDMKIGATRVVDTGDVLAVQGVTNGTHKGDFMDTPATDKPTGNPYLHLLWMKDGKVKKSLYIENYANTMAQIGAAPPDAGPAVPPPDLPTGLPEVIKAEPNQKNIDTVKKLYATFDWELCEKELCAKDLVNHDMAEGKDITDPAEHKKIWDGLKTAFPDFKIENKEIVSAGDWVVAYTLGTGTHKGDLGPIKATNKPLKIDYAEVIKLEDGKIKETWSYMNTLQMLGQLDLLPKPDEKKVAQK